MVLRRGAVLRMVVRFGRLLRHGGRQQQPQRDREPERAETTAAPARTNKVRHLVLESKRVRLPPADGRVLTIRIVRCGGSDDAFGYSGIDRDGVAEPYLVVAGKHVDGDVK